MNNTDFRRLVSDTPRRQQDDSLGGSQRPGSTPMSLGSRARSSIPMTPRTVRGGPHLDFARQLAERNGTMQPPRKFRSTAAPKGSKLASGYVDRARDRDEDADKDDREARIQALEEQMKLGQIEREVFESLRDEITGGDIRATHLIKGLDRRLLERVRRGEDVLSSKTTTDVAPPDKDPMVPQADLDEQLEKLESAEIAPVTHEQTVKKGEMAPPPKPLAGAKRSRNDILAELKASREAARQAALPQLGSRFRKVGEKNAPGSRIERDEKGREVLITVDEDGRVKRKVRKTIGEEKREKQAAGALLMPEAGATPLGMEVPVTPAAPSPPEEEEDGDIFANVGTAYNPLGDAEDEDSASSEDESEAIGKTITTKSGPRDTADTDDEASQSSSPPTPPAQSPPTTNQPQKYNYFNDPIPSNPTTTTTTSNPLTDPTILATLARAAGASSAPDDPPSTATPTQPTPQHHLLAKLTHDRDLDDMDLGFGSSRYGDEDDDGGEGGGSKIKLSEWRGMGGGDEEDDGEEGEKGKGAGKRKRGKKKRVGDKNSVKDVLGVLEGRKKAAG